MKIGFLTPEYPIAECTSSGGIGSSISNLATALLAHGVNVTVFVYGQSTDKILEHGGITIHLIKSRKYSLLSWLHYRKFLQDYLNNQIAVHDIDIIEAPDWTGITAFMKLRAPLVVRFHGSDTYFCKLERRKQKLRNHFLELMAIKGADAYSAPTNFAGRLTAGLFNIEKSGVVTIPNGIAIDRFANHSPADFERGTILYLGTVIRKKGVFELPGIMAEVVKRFSSATLLVAGSDSKDISTGSASTWSLVKQNCDGSLTEKIQYLGKVPFPEVPELIKKAHVCIFPTFAETQGMVTIEAMAMQKAVVSSDFGWAAELIEDGIDGLLADPTDHAAFAEKIVNLLTDDTLRSEIALNARQKAISAFDSRKIAKQNIEFYKTLLQT